MIPRPPRSTLSPYTTLFRSFAAPLISLISSANQMRPSKIFASKDNDVMNQEQEIEPRDLERSEEHTSELQSRQYLVCRFLLAKKSRAYGDAHANLHSPKIGG